MTRPRLRRLHRQLMKPKVMVQLLISKTLARIRPMMHRNLYVTGNHPVVNPNLQISMLLKPSKNHHPTTSLHPTLAKKHPQRKVTKKVKATILLQREILEVMRHIRENLQTAAQNPLNPVVLMKNLQLTMTTSPDRQQNQRAEPRLRRGVQAKQAAIQMAQVTDDLLPHRNRQRQRKQHTEQNMWAVCQASRASP